MRFSRPLADMITRSTGIRSLSSCWPALLFMAVASGGCGRDTGGRVEISGTVRFQDAPLQTGTIEFASTDGKHLNGSTIKGGKYAIPAAQGLTPGKYTVRISASQEEGVAPAGPPGPEAETHRARALIPPEYNINSTLSAEVTHDGGNQFDFDLK